MAQKFQGKNKSGGPLIPGGAQLDRKGEAGRSGGKPMTNQTSLERNPVRHDTAQVGPGNKTDEAPGPSIYERAPSAERKTE